MSGDEFYDGVTVLPSWVEAWFAQQRSHHREVRGEHLEDREDWGAWEHDYNGR